MTSKTGVAAVDRALTVLDAFQPGRPVLTLAELSRETGLYKSTILRLMGSLEYHGYVRQLANGSYQLGPKVSELSVTYQESFDLRDFVHPVMEEIVADTGEAASFFVRDGDRQMCLFRVDGRMTIRDYHIRVGTRWPLNRGASGRIFKVFETRTSRDLEPENFLSVSLGEVNEEMAAISAPVFGVGGALAGVLIVSGPLSRFSGERIAALQRTAIDACVKMSVALGAPAQHFEVLSHYARKVA